MGAGDPFGSATPLSAADAKGTSLASREGPEEAKWDLMCLTRRNRSELGTGRGGEQKRPPPWGRGRGGSGGGGGHSVG